MTGKTYRLALLLALCITGCSPRQKEEQPAVSYQVKRFVALVRHGSGSFEENLYLLYDEKGKKGVIIDPGERIKELERFVKANRIKIVAILNTHGHFDHITANAAYRSIYKGAELYAHGADAKLYDSTASKPAKTVSDKEELNIEGLKIKVIEIPGHTPGSVSFLAGNFLFSGDALFKGSVGRTDNGDLMALQIFNIKRRLLSLDPDVVVFPGHGDRTTIGEEKANNRYLNDSFRRREGV